jgi:hypothetical protein
MVWLAIIQFLNNFENNGDGTCLIAQTVIINDDDDDDDNFLASLCKVNSLKKVWVVPVF